MTRNSKNLILTFAFILAIVLMSSSCRRETSRTTGWEYNDPEWGGFEKTEEVKQETGPGLVFIEGGTFVMGRTEQDVMFDWNNIPRRVTVSSFYMDETEVSNLDYLEYLHWLGRVFGNDPMDDYYEVYRDALPDTLVWRDELAYNEPYVDNYLRHPAYQDHPVVGVSWVQASDYASWRTDRVNEMILVREGLLELTTFDADPYNYFNTEAYLLANQYDEFTRGADALYETPDGDYRHVTRQDGFLLPAYRLPTEAEWEFAALGLIGNTVHERIVERRMYPWNGHQVRSSERETMGIFMANIKRGRGDMMGVAGDLNDAGEVTVPVYAYWPNDYGLYNMGGNVSEWVKDVYRPLSHEDATAFRPFRGNVFKRLEIDEDTGEPIPDEFNRPQWQRVTEEETATRRNYRQADNISYRDGDQASSIFYDRSQQEIEEEIGEDRLMYEYGVTSLINDEARVYKGGSWKDRAYWIVPGTRRFMDQNEAASHIGFRCAMDRVGSPIKY